MATTTLARPQAGADSAAPAASQPISRSLAEFVKGLRYEDIPETVRERARYLILDSIGIAIAASHYDFADVILRGIQALGEGGNCRLVGRPERLPLRDAVLMNGALIHGLDYDDTHMKAIVHATAGCLPVVLNVGEQVEAAGQEAITAYVSGMEVAIRIGMAAKGGFHHAGFHATGIASHFAAALIAGRYYGLNVDQLAGAQGIAASTASAVQVFLEEGTWSKRLHPGWGGVGGITAARLAQNGFVAPSRPYEGRWGLFDSHLQEHEKDVDYAAMTAGLGSEWEIMGMALKPYPVCHFLHTCAEAASDLHAEIGSPDEIAAITVLLPEPTIKIVTEPDAKKRRPTTDYEGKFSAQYVAAAGLVRGRFTLAELEAEAMRDPAILRLADLVQVKADADTAFPQFYSGGVTVRTKDGKEFSKYHRVNKGAGDRVLSNDAMREKYDQTAAVAVPRGTADRVADAVLSFDKSPLETLWQALVPKAGS